MLFSSQRPPQKKFPKGGKRGFSLVELIIAVAIFVTLSATFLFNYGSFDRRVTVDILAHQIAEWIHDSQVSAMSIRRAGTDQTKFPGYGLHFDLATPNKFIYFADLDGNRSYAPLSGNQQCGDPSLECEQIITLLQGNIVSALCGNVSSGGTSVPCASAIPGNPSLYTTNTVDVVFARPNPFDATLFGDATTAYSQVEITVSSPKGYRHTITVWTTGQVSVR